MTVGRDGQTHEGFMLLLSALKHAVVNGDLSNDDPMDVVAILKEINDAHDETTHVIENTIRGELTPWSPGGYRS